MLHTHGLQKCTMPTFVLGTGLKTIITISMKTVNEWSLNSISKGKSTKKFKATIPLSVEQSVMKKYGNLQKV